MAYLRGGSVVDGDLYIEGKLIIENTTDANGVALPKFGTEEDAKGADYIVVLKDNNGGITHVKSIASTWIDAAKIIYDEDGNEVLLNDEDGNEVLLNKVEYNKAPLKFSYDA